MGQVHTTDTKKDECLEELIFKIRAKLFLFDQQESEWATTPTSKITTKKAAAKPKAAPKSSKKASPTKPTKVTKPTKTTKSPKTTKATKASSKAAALAPEEPVHAMKTRSQAALLPKPRPRARAHKKDLELNVYTPEYAAIHPKFAAEPTYPALIAELKAAEKAQEKAAHAFRKDDGTQTWTKEDLRAEEIRVITMRADAQQRRMRAHHALSILAGEIPADSKITYC
ncbi:hypothetical protein B0A55_13046 [Friedmanniomyces simplex]|uniref:Uncharacterized protein n=1 Tax=Friedmanniomyces simplex TaxID=329884 RepID=A0A4U0VEE1_9PEZI|nr:hypothetical protein B0A55_13046 [Friedmanniomyces simplex]